MERPAGRPQRAAKLQATERLAAYKRKADDGDTDDNDVTETKPQKVRVVPARAKRNVKAPVVNQPAPGTRAAPENPWREPLEDVAAKLDHADAFVDDGSFPDPIPRQVRDAPGTAPPAARGSRPPAHRCPGAARRCLGLPRQRRCLPAAWASSSVCCMPAGSPRPGAGPRRGGGTPSSNCRRRISLPRCGNLKDPGPTHRAARAWLTQGRAGSACAARPAQRRHGTARPCRRPAGPPPATSPFPARARCCSQVQVAASPMYITDQKLGKGGFGIVYLGKRDPKARARFAGVSEVGGAATAGTRFPRGSAADLVSQRHAPAAVQPGFRCSCVTPGNCDVRLGPREPWREAWSVWGAPPAAVAPPNARAPAPASAPVQVALKFEHKSSKGCNNAPPHEWKLYKALGQCHGLPQVYHRGEQGNWYIMVSGRPPPRRRWRGVPPVPPHLPAVPAATLLPCSHRGRRSWSAWDPACGMCGTPAARS
jgi:hypothetical protein